MVEQVSEIVLSPHSNSKIPSTNSISQIPSCSWTHSHIRTFHLKEVNDSHTFYLSQTPQTCLCKNFLSGVNFSRMSEKKCIYMTFSETFLVFLVILVVFLGVKFGFRKSCLCKRNDKYKVWSRVKANKVQLPVFVHFFLSF